MAESTYRCQARDPESAKSRRVKLSELTARDLVCWFERSDDYFCHARHVDLRHDRNPDFDPANPCGYQWSRVQLIGGTALEETRQWLCIHCQVRVFSNVTGHSSYISHLDTWHPHEVPEFVRMVRRELGLKPSLEPVNPIAYNRRDPRHLLVEERMAYRHDGYFNQLRFAARPHMANVEMTLSEVTEKHVMFWFCREAAGFAEHQLRHERYEDWPLFNQKKPQFLQICRYEVPIEPFRSVLCLYCQEPRFYRVLGKWGLYGHIAMHHYGVDFPPHSVVREYYRDWFPE